MVAVGLSASDAGTVQVWESGDNRYRKPSDGISITHMVLQAMEPRGAEGAQSHQRRCS